MSDAGDRVVMTGEQVSRTVTRMAHEILEKNTGDDRLAIVGIHTRGAFLARRLHAILRDIAGARGADRRSRHLLLPRRRRRPRRLRRRALARRNPIVKSTDLDFEVDGATVVLVDDVLYTGRTIRAAIDALFDYGRPARVQLAVLVDRGHRELPIRPDYIGKNLPTAPRERIEVCLAEADGRDEVVLVSPAGEELRWPSATCSSIDDLTRADGGAHPRDGRKLPARAAARHQEGAHPARTHHHQHVLRVLDAHPDELRAGRQAAVGRHHERARRGLGGRQGRVAQGHDPHAVGLPARHHRHAPPARSAPAGSPAATPQASVINAGDGKFQHPSQCLLDLFTMRQALGRELDGKKVWIVGDILHSRVARSDIAGFQLLGMDVTVAGPPSLIPRDVESLGRRRSSTTLDRLPEADVIYLLRMQMERMQEGANFIPSLREYSSLYGMTLERLRPGQKVMHPGPINRGVEISPAIADHAGHADPRAGRSGLAVRMAILYRTIAGYDERSADERGAA